MYGLENSPALPFLQMVPRRNEPGGLERKSRLPFSTSKFDSGSQILDGRRRDAWMRVRYSVLIEVKLGKAGIRGIPYHASELELLVTYSL